MRNMRMRRMFLVFVLGSSNWLVCAQGPAPAPQLGSFQGTVTDAQNKPVAGALVMITRTFRTPNEVVSPYSQSVRTASDGSFLAQGFPPGTYTYCAQATDDSFLDGCHWGAPLLDVKVSGGQRVRAAIRVSKGSIL